MEAHLLPPVRPELTVLPARLLQGGVVERSYPGAADVAGWTLFLRTNKAYIHQDCAPLLPTEREARTYLREHYGALIDLSHSDGIPGRQLE